MRPICLNWLGRSIIAGVIICLFFTAAYAQQFEFLYNHKKESVPFKLIKNLIIIPVHINGKGPFNFILDTGVGLCVITEASLIDTLKPKHVRKIRITGFGEGKDLDAYVVPSMNFRIGNTVAENLPAAILQKNAFDLSAFAGMPIHGLIGYDFFNSFIIRINYASHHISMYRHYSGFILKKSYKIPISIEEKKPYITSEIGLTAEKSITGKLIIDTGAGHPLSLETYPGVSFDIPEVNIPANLGIGLTGPISGHLARIKSLAIGNFKLKEVLAAFPDYDDVASKTASSRIGNIGNSILRRFETVFDYSRNALYLKPSSSLNDPFEHDMSGMELYSSGKDYKRIFVLKVEEPSPAYDAGIAEGDEILAINLKPVAELTREEIDAIFRLKDGRSLAIDLIPRGTKSIHRVILTLKRRI